LILERVPKEDHDERDDERKQAMRKKNLFTAGRQREGINTG
jgi:hypothetical protein